MSRPLDHRQRLLDSEAAITRLTAEREDAENRLLVIGGKIPEAEALVAEAVARVGQIEPVLAEVMVAVARGAPPEMQARRDGLRMDLADARGQLVDTRSRLDQLVRDREALTSRLADIAMDIASWQRRGADAASAIDTSLAKT